LVPIPRHEDDSLADDESSFDGDREVQSVERSQSMSKNERPCCGKHGLCIESHERNSANAVDVEAIQDAGRRRQPARALCRTDGPGQFDPGEFAARDQIGAVEEEATQLGMAGLVAQIGAD